MIKITVPVIALVLIILFSGCYPEPEFVPEFPVGEVEGYQPIYASEEQSAIEFIAARPLSNPGKIYIIGNFLLINEKYEGIHVFNNADPSHPAALGFLRVAGNTEMAVKNNVLYLDHATDLVALDIADWNTIHELSRLKQEHWKQNVPPGEGRYFMCVDPSKGIVVGWELSMLKNPKCFR